MITDPRSAESGGCHLPDPDGWWYDGARRALEVLAAGHGIFSADDLFAPPFAIADPPHPSQVGSAFASARADGLIRPVGYVASKRASRNGGAHRLWRGTPKARFLAGGDAR